VIPICPSSLLFITASIKNLLGVFAKIEKISVILIWTRQLYSEDETRRRYRFCIFSMKSPPTVGGQVGGLRGFQWYDRGLVSGVTGVR
jgi:hypothetical protein